jgi:hypothetical protein
MDLHNGQISVASDGEGKGCTLTVKIPMLRYSGTGPINSPSTSLQSRPSFLPHTPKSISPRDIEVSSPELVDRISIITRNEFVEDTPKTNKTKTLPSLEVLVVDDSNLNR